MSSTDTLQPAYFDAVYAANADPWQFETSLYERAKYAATLAALPAPRFERAFEIGCSIGVLTVMLAARCDELLAVDVSAAALQTVRERLSHLPQMDHVALRQMTVPQAFPEGDFDLVMLSEVGYYWSPDDLGLASQRILAALRPGASLVLVHWTPAVADYPLTGDAVHEHFLQLCGQGQGLRHVNAQREATYRLDVFERGMAGAAA